VYGGKSPFGDAQLHNPNDNQRRSLMKRSIQMFSVLVGMLFLISFAIPVLASAGQVTASSPAARYRRHHHHRHHHHVYYGSMTVSSVLGGGGEITMRLRRLHEPGALFIETVSMSNVPGVCTFLPFNGVDGSQHPEPLTVSQTFNLPVSPSEDHVGAGVPMSGGEINLAFRAFGPEIRGFGDIVTTPDAYTRCEAIERGWAARLPR
jgi:hypothetical protein